MQIADEATVVSFRVQDGERFGAGQVVATANGPARAVLLAERYAVRCGGGYNHRYSLSDALLGKDNHLAVMMRDGATSVSGKLQEALAQLPHTVHREVEVDRMDQIEPVLAAGA